MPAAVDLLVDHHPAHDGVNVLLGETDSLGQKLNAHRGKGATVLEKEGLQSNLANVLLQDLLNVLGVGVNIPATQLEDEVVGLVGVGGFQRASGSNDVVLGGLRGTGEHLAIVELHDATERTRDDPLLDVVARRDHVGGFQEHGGDQVNALKLLSVDEGVVGNLALLLDLVLLSILVALLGDTLGDQLLQFVGLEELGQAVVGVGDTTDTESTETHLSHGAVEQDLGLDISVLDLVLEMRHQKQVTGLEEPLFKSVVVDGVEDGMGLHTFVSVLANNGEQFVEDLGPGTLGGRRGGEGGNGDLGTSNGGGGGGGIGVAAVVVEGHPHESDLSDLQPLTNLPVITLHLAGSFKNQLFISNTLDVFLSGAIQSTESLEKFVTETTEESDQAGSLELIRVLGGGGFFNTDALVLLKDGEDFNDFVVGDHPVLAVQVLLHTDGLVEVGGDDVHANSELLLDILGLFEEFTELDNLGRFVNLLLAGLSGDDALQLFVHTLHGPLSSPGSGLGLLGGGGLVLVPLPGPLLLPPLFFLFLASGHPLVETGGFFHGRQFLLLGGAFEEVIALVLLFGVLATNRGTSLNFGFELLELILVFSEVLLELLGESGDGTSTLFVEGGLGFLVHPLDELLQGQQTLIVRRRSKGRALGSLLPLNEGVVELGEVVRKGRAVLFIDVVVDSVGDLLQSIEMLVLVRLDNAFDLVLVLRIRGASKPRGQMHCGLIRGKLFL